MTYKWRCCEQCHWMTTFSFSFFFYRGLIQRTDSSCACSKKIWAQRLLRWWGGRDKTTHSQCFLWQYSYVSVMARNWTLHLRSVAGWRWLATQLIVYYSWQQVYGTCWSHKLTRLAPNWSNLTWLEGKCHSKRGERLQMEPSLTFLSPWGTSYLASYHSSLKEAQTVSWCRQVAQWMSGGGGEKEKG